MNVNKNFVGSRMNKSLDERLIPKGEYTDALNIRISSDEDGEAGSAENAKGNELLYTPVYNGVEINSTCIGALEDGVNETIYWFITSDTVDMILSYDTTTSSVIYHVVSENVLNFSDKHLINGVNLIDDFLFFTDNYNPPRKINIKSSYPQPVSGVDQITEDDISVIVRPPINSPKLKLIKKSNVANYIEDKFIRFAYRYKYKDGEYSALSEFSDLAFDPKQFKIDYGTYDMVGMRNNANIAVVTFNTGSKNVVGVDLCFKLSNSNVINVVERFDKFDNGWTDNDDVSVEFSNQKIYTTLPESELLRVYDNVPKYAKSQTSVGNRILYGNYKDGYDIDTVLDYELDLINEDVGFSGVPAESDDGVDYSDTSGGTIENSAVSLNFEGLDLVEGGSLIIDINVSHDSFGGSATYTDEGNEVLNSFNNSFEFIFPRDYTSLSDLVSDPDFLKEIQLTDASGFPGTLSDGYSLSDLFYSDILPNASGDWEISGGGITTSPEGFRVTSSGDNLIIQVPAVIYEDTTNTGTFAYEYFSMSSSAGSIYSVADIKSLHSNRDYEVGMVYLDEYNRASTALVCNNNTVHVEPRYSDRKNYIETTIKHKAPSWAKRYRFVMKPSKSSYDTIYVNQYYFDTSESSWWLKLEGDNQTSFNVGDDLIVKRSSTGPVYDLVKTKALEIATKPKYFISEDEEFPPSSGLFVRIKPSNFTISNSEKEDVDLGFKSTRVPKGGWEKKGIAYPTFIEDPENEGQYIEYDIPAGSEVRIYFRARQNEGSYFGSEDFIFDRSFTATQDYNNFYDFIIGENIDFNKPTNDPEIDGNERPVHTAVFDSTIGDSSGDTSYVDDYKTLHTFSGGRDAEMDVIGVRYMRSGTPGTSDFRSYLSFRTGGRKRNSKWYRMNVHIQVIRSSGVLVFETIPNENTNEIYYESHKSYPITEDGYHNGDIQNQTSTDPAIVNLDLFNCFAFGNGVESFKIDDGLAKPGFNIGARVTAVSEQDYKETHRYADITYSGVYNQESRLNKLNEFNLALVNFKSLEQDYGPIEVMHSRESNILVLQEDKISYVLANGKNLFSDAQAGGSIINTPEVLGKQIPRTEEYGISNNPESFATYGYDVYFTDTKRGSVINLKGNSGAGDRLNIISNIGMGSFFRDLFVNNSTKMQLGGYDPYTKEYVLSSTQNNFKEIQKISNCGFTVSQQSSSSVLERNVKLNEYSGTVDIDYNVSSGSIAVSVTYNNVEVIDQTVTGSGTLSFVSDEYNVYECDIIITPTNATYTLDFGCVQTEDITVIRIVRNTEIMSGKTIHHEMFWSDNGVTSNVVNDLVEFGDGPVSLYRTLTGPESFGSIPPEGGVVTMRYKKEITDTATFSSDKFKYLVSDTLYDESDINTLVPLLQETTPISNPSNNIYEASFTYENLSDKPYLYLVWDYANTTTIDLCYSEDSSVDACCDCDQIQ